MERKIIIAPSLLAADSKCLGLETEKVDKAGAEWLHLDIMDGHFVPNLSYSAQIVKALRPVTNMKFDVHLMISNPEKYMDDFIEAGADIITVHAEAVNSDEKLCDIADYLHKNNVLAGVSVKPKTDISMIENVVDAFDMVLIMTVEPGFGGQKYISEAESKIKWASKIADLSDKRLYVEVDGGINSETAVRAASCGADVLVAGSAVFKADNVKEAIDKIRESANEAFSHRR